MKKETLTLKSLNAQEYADTQVDCVVIDDMKTFAEQYIKFLAEKNIYPKTAQKNAEVYARKGEIGEEVDTLPRVQRDGKIYVIGETKGKVKVDGSMIVKNPDGEEYIVKPEAFDKKYKKGSMPGVYQPIADPIKYIILEDDIAFNAPWGERMYALKGAALNITNLNDIYAIQNEAFAKTYSQVTKTDAIDDCNQY